MYSAKSTLCGRVVYKSVIIIIIITIILQLKYWLVLGFQELKQGSNASMAVGWVGLDRGIIPRSVMHVHQGPVKAKPCTTYQQLAHIVIFPMAMLFVAEKYYIWVELTFFMAENSSDM